MTLPAKTERGSRKLTHAREMALIMTLGFIVAAWLKIPSEMFAAYAAGLTGLSGAFVWGNRVEHLNQPKPPAPTP